MRVAILGHGNVGGAVAGHLRRLGHDVVIGVDPVRPDTTGPLRDRIPSLRTAPFADAVDGADLVILAVPFGAAEAVLAPLASALSGTVLIDATNPVGPGLRHGLDSMRSGAEAVADLVPGARVVKALSVYGAENLGVTPHASSPVRPVMPIAGDDPEAKALVSGLVDGMGWDALDTGPLAQALHLEHMTLLWVRMVRGAGRSPDLVWAALGG